MVSIRTTYWKYHMIPAWTLCIRRQSKVLTLRVNLLCIMRLRFVFRSLHNDGRFPTGGQLKTGLRCQLPISVCGVCLHGDSNYGKANIFIVPSLTYRRDRQWAIRAYPIWCEKAGNGLKVVLWGRGISFMKAIPNVRLVNFLIYWSIDISRIGFYYTVFAVFVYRAHVGIF